MTIETHPAKRPRLDDLNDKQKAAVAITTGYRQIIAGPGTGKTKVIAHSIQALLKQGTSPGAILALTFTRTAASEMEERIGDLTGASVGVRTFHALGKEVIQAHYEKLGYQKKPAILDRDGSEEIIRRLSGKKGGDLQELCGKIAKQRSSLDRCDPDSLLATYKRELKRDNKIDFEGMIVDMLELFDKHPKVKDNYRKQWDYIFVDEYQDTSNNQILMIQHLVKEHCCVVGDPDQSIYGWRDADGRAFERFEEMYPSTRTITLDMSYRCPQLVLDAAYALISHNGREHVKLQSAGAEGGAHFTSYYVVEQEVNAILEKLHAIRSAGTTAAILFRAHIDKEPFIAALEKTRIPYINDNKVTFWERKVVNDITALLRFAVNPLDEDAFKRTAKLVNGIGDALVKAILQKEGASALAKCKEMHTAEMQKKRPPKRATSLKKYIECVEKIQSMLDGPANAAVQAAIDDLEYEALVSKTKDEAKRKRDQSLLKELRRWAEGISARDFVKRYAAPPVELRTFYTAKGREYDQVFMPGLEKDILPHVSADLQEERRVCYVGMTRAKRALFMSAITGKSSQFVREAGLIAF